MPHDARIIMSNATHLDYDPLMTHAQAASVLTISPLTLRDWRYKKPMNVPRAFKHGQKIRYRRSDVYECLARLVERGREGCAPTSQCSARVDPQVRLATQAGPAKRDISMNLTEAAGYLNIPKSTLYKMRIDLSDPGPEGELIHGLVRYRLSSLNAWVERHLEPLSPGPGDRHACDDTH